MKITNGLNRFIIFVFQVVVIYNNCLLKIRNLGVKLFFNSITEI